jgi:glutamine amidotransferase
MLFDKSQEGGNIKGLGILKGDILKFPKEIKLKIPHVGWNNINIENKSSKLFDKIDNNEYVYFVHSYYLKTDDTKIISAKTNYGIEFVSSIEKGNVFRYTIPP